jgi:hypothetical protein
MGSGRAETTVLEKRRRASSRPGVRPVAVTPEEPPGDVTVPTAAVQPTDYEMPLPRQVPSVTRYLIPGGSLMERDPNAATVD